jgi:hypothetical protein
MDKLADVIHQQGGMERFKGFYKPNTTPTPDEIFDRFLTALTHGELKVLLYIVRRTYGFKKASDQISLKQICEGIRKQDGERLDSGTGLERRSAIRVVKSLEAKGIIRVKRVRTADGYNCINVYSLRFRDGEEM